jgi:sulfur carrier protein ThiS
MNTTKLLKILLNGELYLINFDSISAFHLKKYLLSMDIKIITEYNYKIIDEKQSDKLQIHSYDKLEFISIVGGG